ncbi:HesA/MoeB/ThiF family protein [Arthrobacter alpinus]|uniref:HesA/MoeB/ThiF family protein n=1 Tax=Arthrobacter alpinus TaxID=656366 RepID=UPI0005C90A77|nr:ThiF family adenylyltransferase [Arthrobacter alpinus]
MKPQLRTGHDIIHLDRGVSVVGSMTYGIGQEIVDPEGLLLELNNIFDGTRELDAALLEFSQKSGVSLAGAQGLLTQLEENGHIEDSSALTSLTEQEKERYSRSAHYFSWIAKEAKPNRWTPQEQLKSSSVCVLGVGGVGGAIAGQLAASGVGRITLVDFDVVEESNLNRQILFGTSDVGRPKAQAAADRVREINPLSHIEYFNEKVESPERLRELFDNHTLVFRAADHPDDLPFRVSDAALKTNTPWIDCSYNGPMIVCCTFVPGVTGCYRCVRESEKIRLAELGKSSMYSDHVPDINSALGPVVQIAGSLAAYEGIRLLTGNRPQTVGRALHQNMFIYSHSYEILIPEDCNHGE